MPAGRSEYIVSIIINARDQTSGPAASAAGALGRIGDAVKGMVMAYAGMRGVQAVQQLAMLGAQAEMTEVSFARMTASVGLSSGILDEMRAAAGGTIPTLTLMQAMNTSLIGTTQEFGLAMAQAYPQLVQMARAASMANPALGDTSYMIRSLSIGLKRMSPMILDNLGLQLKLGEANEIYAARLGKTTDELTIQEKQMALLQETLKAGAILVNQVGIQEGSTAIQTQTYTAALADLRVEIGKNLTATLAYQGVLASTAHGITEQMRTGRANIEMWRQYTEVLDRALEAGTITEEQHRSQSDELGSLMIRTRNARLSNEEFAESLYEINEDLGLTTELLRVLDIEPVRTSAEATAAFAEGMRHLREETGQTIQEQRSFFAWVTQLTMAFDAGKISRDEMVAAIDQIGRSAGLTDVQLLAFTASLEEQNVAMGRGIQFQAMLAQKQEQQIAIQRGMADVASTYLLALQRMVDANLTSQSAATEARAAFAELESQYLSGGISADAYKTALSLLGTNFGIITDEGKLAAEAIIAAGAASSGSVPAILNLAEATRILGAGYSAAAVAADKLARKSKGITDDVAQQAESMAMSYAGMVPWETVKADYDKVVRWAEDSAGDLAKLSDMEKDFLIKQQFDTSFGRSEAHKKGTEDMLRAEEGYLKDSQRLLEQQESQMISVLEGIMSPTMPAEWWQGLIPREDEWDEWARRAADVANLGPGSPWFEQLMETFPSFRDIVGQAEDPRAAAAQWIDMFYKGMVPEEASIEGIVNKYAQVMEEKAQKADFMQRVVEAIKARGVEVEMPVVKAILGEEPEFKPAEWVVTPVVRPALQEVLAVPEAATMEGAGAGISADAYYTGWQMAIQEKPWASDLVSIWMASLEANQEGLLAAGTEAGEVIAEGVSHALAAPNFLLVVATKVAPEVARILERRDGKW